MEGLPFQSVKFQHRVRQVGVGLRLSFHSLIERFIVDAPGRRPPSVTSGKTVALACAWFDYAMLALAFAVLLVGVLGLLR